MTLRIQIVANLGGKGVLVLVLSLGLKAVLPSLLPRLSEGPWQRHGSEGWQLPASALFYCRCFKQVYIYI